MHLHPNDTIAALASAPGAAARGIIRASGKEVAAIIRKTLVTTDDDEVLRARAASVHHVTLTIGGQNRPLPVALYFWPNRRSYTGEPLAELHLAGSPPILEAVLATLYQAGMRPAQPGEFTLRAFLAGRIDLMQAEAVLGVIDAADQRELQSALEQLAGGISTRIGRLRSDLLDLLADLEAGLDFADEAIEFVSHAALIERLQAHRQALDDLIRRSNERTRGSAVPRVVLAGPPNAGKSTLYNALVGHAAAIVSEVRGTTRDYLASEVTWDGLALLLIDTAGSDDAATGITQEAQRQRLQQLEQADIVVWCQPADEPEGDSANEPADAANPRETRPPAITVRMKADLHASYSAAGSALSVSGLTGAGLAEFKAAIVEQLSEPAFGARGLIGTTAARCRKSLLAAAAALDRAIGIARLEADQELLAIETREALEELGEIVGAVYTDDILDRIFSKFCIGK